jgi:hypothetical protein
MPISGNYARPVVAPETTAARMRALHDQVYAARYEALYLRPWLRKHELNMGCVGHLNRRTPGPARSGHGGAASTG